MTLLSAFRASVAAVVICLSACTHTPPGTSVEVALAKRPDVVRYPAPPAPAVPEPTVRQIASVEPDLPNSKLDQVAEAYTRGQFCMQAGKDEEAIAAFEETVKIDPTFVEAWNGLALLYEKVGDEKKAMDAFRKSKKIAGR